MLYVLRRINVNIMTREMMDIKETKQVEKKIKELNDKYPNWFIIAVEKERTLSQILKSIDI